MHGKLPGRRDFLRTSVHLMLLGAGWGCASRGGGGKTPSAPAEGKEARMKLSLSARVAEELFQQGRGLAEPGRTHPPGPEPRVSGPLHAGLPGRHPFAARTGGPHEPPNRGGRPPDLHGHRRLRRAPQRRAGSVRTAQHRALPGPGGSLRGRPDPDLHEGRRRTSPGPRGPPTAPPSGASAWPTSPTAPASSRRWRAPSRCWRRSTDPTSESSTNPPTG